ncbi:hypothetical protein M885DRAFT_585638 [Pelagophyceae sp. CCMP2097]|nr:hypothetical protein M885DRAFT_585638 [Pelagophyceae sp. CCMP2097]
MWAAWLALAPFAAALLTPAYTGRAAPRRGVRVRAAGDGGSGDESLRLAQSLIDSAFGAALLAPEFCYRAAGAAPLTKRGFAKANLLATVLASSPDATFDFEDVRLSPGEESVVLYTARFSGTHTAANWPGDGAKGFPPSGLKWSTGPTTGRLVFSGGLCVEMDEGFAMDRSDEGIHASTAAGVAEAMGAGPEAGASLALWLSEALRRARSADPSGPARSIAPLAPRIMCSVAEEALRSLAAGKGAPFTADSTFLGADFAPQPLNAALQRRQFAPFSSLQNLRLDAADKRRVWADVVRPGSPVEVASVYIDDDGLVSRAAVGFRVGGRAVDPLEALLGLRRALDGASEAVEDVTAQVNAVTAPATKSIDALKRGVFGVVNSVQAVRDNVSAKAEKLQAEVQALPKALNLRVEVAPTNDAPKVAVPTTPDEPVRVKKQLFSFTPPTFDAPPKAAAPKVAAPARDSPPRISFTPPKFDPPPKLAPEAAKAAASAKKPFFAFTKPKFDPPPKSAREREAEAKAARRK